MSSGFQTKVRHTERCTSSEDGWSLEILDLGSKGIVQPICSKNKSADQLHGYRAADQRLCFHIYKNQVFS